MIVYRLALLRGLALAVGIDATWRRARPSVIAYVAAAPATFAYVAIVATTTWVLAGVTTGTAQAILHQHSSNLHELGTNPLKALVRSAFLLDDYAQLASTILLALVLAPVERWLGTARWLLVFAAGHAGATLATALAIWVAIRTGHASKNLETTVDVGVSYGFAAVGGILTWGLARRSARAWAFGISALLMAALVLSHTFTDVGHLVAFAIGLGLRGLARQSTGDVPPDPLAAMGRAAGRLRHRPPRG